jgi:hypothetical protein
MSDRYCPCGARLDRSSAVRHLYTKWKKENPEFSSFITRLEGDMIDDSDIDGISVNIFSVSLNISMLFVY